MKEEWGEKERERKSAYKLLFQNSLQIWKYNTNYSIGHNELFNWQLTSRDTNYPAEAMSTI